MSSIPLAVFASGSGSNLQAILDYFGTDSSGEQQGEPRTPAHVALVVTDRADAGVLQRSAAGGIPSKVIPVRGRSEEDIAEETMAALDRAGVELVALAGYLRRVPAAVIERFPGRIVNIHPALLPAFGGPGMFGARVHRAVLDAGCTVTGATIHHVTEEYDRGRIIAQWPVPVLPGDDAATLAARVLAIEHRLYPATLDFLAAQLVADRSVEDHAADGRHHDDGFVADALSFEFGTAALPSPRDIHSLIRTGGR